MLKMSWCIVGYGVVLVLIDAIGRSMGFDARLGSATVVPSWSLGLIIVAAGVASNLGRRSIRATGIYVGLILPLFLGGLFFLQAVRLWEQLQKTQAIVLSILAVTSLATVILANYLRPREGIATRGYAVPIVSPPVTKAPQAEPKRRSEAG